MCVVTWSKAPRHDTPHTKTATEGGRQQQPPASFAGHLPSAERAVARTGFAGSSGAQFATQISRYAGTVASSLVTDDRT